MKKHNKASQPRSLRSLDLVSLGRCWRRYEQISFPFYPRLISGMYKLRDEWFLSDWSWEKEWGARKNWCFHSKYKHQKCYLHNITAIGTRRKTDSRAKRVLCTPVSAFSSATAENTNTRWWWWCVCWFRNVKSGASILVQVLTHNKAYKNYSRQKTASTRRANTRLL